MRILVTGGAGFIAHHIIEEILDKTNWEVVTLDSLNFDGNLNRLSDMLKSRSDANRLTYVYHDLKAPVNQVTSNKIGNVDYILHLAAGSHVDLSIKDPYSASKAGGEEMATAFHNTYNLPVYITHSMNVFGERQQHGAFIPLCIKKVLNNELLTIHSDETLTKSPARHYIYVKEVASAILFLLNNNFVSNDPLIKVPKFNITGNDEIHILSLAKVIAKILDKELNYEMKYTERPGGDMGYSLSAEYMKSLGWEPNTHFFDHIERVVKWYTTNREWLMV